MCLRLDWSCTMSSFTILVLISLLSLLSVAQSRPRDKVHKGLYDDLKPVPFVDNPDEYGYMYGVYSAKLGKKDNKHDATHDVKHDDKKDNDPLEQYYERYNKENNRLINGEGITRDVEGNSAGDEEPDLTQLPVEGGAEDTKSKRLDKLDNEEVKNVERKMEELTTIPSEDVKDKKGHRHGKHGKKKNKGKKKSGKKSGKKSKKDKTVTTSKPESDENYFGSIDEEPSNFNMDKFYKEHPDFKENIGTITDGKGGALTTTPAEAAPTTIKALTKTVTQSDSSRDDDGDNDDTDDSDIDDDFDDHKKHGDSQSNDKSSEEYQFYDYYDEHGDSSYSSSEIAAENANYGTPYDWFKQHDRMYGDQPAAVNSREKDQNVDTTTQKGKQTPKIKTEPVTKMVEVTTTTPAKEVEDKLEIMSTETIPKTDIEPSTSPNPPTPQKDVRSTVTQPAVPQWKQKLNSWNYIESRPVESCRGDSDCTAGRMCKFGLCLCGQPDFCDGHEKPVCGSDGQLYNSHCELHRTACILGFHIRIDHENTCISNQQTDSAGVIPTEQASEPIKEYKQRKSNENVQPIVSDVGPETIVKKVDVVDQIKEDVMESESLDKDQAAESVDSDEIDTVESDAKKEDIDDVLDMSEVFKDVVIGGVIEKASPDMINRNFEEEVDSSEDDDDDDFDESDSEDYDEHGYVVTTPLTPDDGNKENIQAPAETDKVSLGEGSLQEVESDFKDDDSLVPLFCTPDVFLKFKADVLEYHCITFDQQHCDRQTQEDKQKLAALMFNYFDHNYSGKIEKEELWEMQLLERIDEISSLCTLLDLVTFHDLGNRDGKLSADEFIQAFDIPDLLEHKLEVVPLLTTVGNGLEVKCDVTASTDVVWKRNDVDLSLLDFPGISVLSDGSLYIETIGVAHVSNFTCYDRKKPSVKQTHMLTIQKPPHVIVSPASLDALDGDNMVLHCHAEGHPLSTIEWQFDDMAIQQGAKYSIKPYENSLTVNNVSYLKDSGLYKCIARNNAGVAEASIEMTVHPDNETRYYNKVPEAEESFIVFHDDGYTMHEPSLCLTQREVLPDFGNFFYIPDELDAPPALCESGVPCVWGSAINVRDTFVYATQPRENRIVVIDVKSYNPNQVIFTDHIPVSLHYIDHLDEVWVLCWNGESDNGSKTIVIIRNASQKIQHHAVHTQPIGNRFDLVQDLYLPPDSELHHPYKYGYTVHNGQQGLFKIELITKKYLKAVDLTKYACVPNSVAFVPLGGHVLVECIQKSANGETSVILNLDYITDVVTQNFSMPGVPYVSPDSNSVVIIDQETGKVSVYRVTDKGAIERHFEVSVESSVDMITFHKARYYSGYDLYLVSAEAPIIYSISLTNGQIDTIKDVGETDPALYVPWAKKSRPLVSGDIFSDFLSTTAQSTMVILDGHHHKINCDFKDLSNPTVLTYTHID